MDSSYCFGLMSILEPYLTYRDRNITQLSNSLIDFCTQIATWEYNSEIEGKYSEPMVLIGIYISTASLFCILAMVLDLLYGFRNKKFWFPTKYFYLNAASITVITVAMKLPVDLSSPMPGSVEQVAKLGGLAFMCTMMCNFMPSLASMDNKSLLVNVIGLSILVITVVVNIFIQIKTHVVHSDTVIIPPSIVAYIYMAMLLFLLIILISSAITIPTTKKILEFKYQAASKTALNDQNSQENPSSTVEKLRRLVKRYWIMAETGSPQFVIVSNPLSSASGMICAISLIIYIYLVWLLVLRPVWTYAGWGRFLIYLSVYKWSVTAILITQFIGIVVGSCAPIYRCFTILSFKSFAKNYRKRFMVFKVEKYWTQKLCEWKESGISFLSNGRRTRALLYNLKNLIISFCIILQKVTVVSCKIIGLIPIIVIIFVVYCSYYYPKSLKEMFFTSSTAASSDDINEDISSYVLLLEDNTRLAKKTLKRISDSMDRLIQNAEKKQHKNLLKLLEKSVTFDGVETFDADQIQSLVCVEPVNSWSLPIVSLTCIAIALPNIRKDMVDKLLKSVGEGLSHTHLVEECLNKASEYVNIQRAAMKVWHEVENKHKWLENTLERSDFVGKAPIEIVRSFACIAEEIVNEFNRKTNAEPLEDLPLNVIAANSMYRIAKTIMQTYESNNLEIVEDELFTRLSVMIADILAACLTNIRRVIIMKCHESVIEKREASVMDAVNLLGQTFEIIKRLDTRVPSMNQDKMAFIDEWRLHMRQP